jgi:hypothetical protein
MTGARVLGNDEPNAGVDRPIRASSWADPGFDGQASGNSGEGGGELGRLTSGTGTGQLMWRSTSVRFEGTGRCSGQHHITSLATQEQEPGIGP